jgi:Tfp pilus assembly protein PilO
MSLSLNTMSLRLKLILLGVAAVFVAAGWYLIVYHPSQKHLATVRAQVTAKKQEVATLESQLAHLQALEANAPKLQALLARYSAALPSDPNLPQFILQMNDAATKAGVDWISVAPSLPAAPSASGTAAPGAPTTNVATGLRQITVSISTTGKYFALQNFMYRLERMNRVLRVDTFSISGGQNGSLSVQLAMRMFVGPAAAAPATTGTGA